MPLPVTTPLISVIIPTYNRPRELALCLAGFAAQTVPHHLFEIIVVDDGSTNDTQQIIGQFESTLRLKLLQTPHLGPGAARNEALKHSVSPLLILYDDDLKPAPRLVEHCLTFNYTHPDESAMALLYFVPDPAIVASTFTRWAFVRLYPFPLAACVGGWQRFWSGTLTCKQSLFRHAQFDPGYRMLEDAELALRFSRCVDLRVHFDRAVLGTFTRQLTLGQFFSRQYRVGYYSHTLARQYSGAINYQVPPYSNPESFVVDAAELGSVVTCAYALENVAATGEQLRVLGSLWGRIDAHARAQGWIAARDGNSPCPPAIPASTSDALLKACELQA